MYNLWRTVNLLLLPHGDKLKKRLNIFSECLGRCARLMRGNEGKRIIRR